MECTVTAPVRDRSGPMRVKALAEPADTLLILKNYSNLSWSLSRQDLAVLDVLEDGTAVLTPEKPGTVVLTAKDAVSGRSARMNVRILTPVTAVEITGPDTVAPGKSGIYRAMLTPKNPGDRKVTWSVDQVETIAKISPNGQLTVMKETPTGTVITVTCQAQGSAQERIARKQITVK